MKKVVVAHYASDKACLTDQLLNRKTETFNLI